ncbi:MAG: toll/interleukin-1 receptor domain-containing protein [Candidatus Hodarchaeota archaeon]
MSKIKSHIQKVLDIEHYLPIIANENNWEKIFSDIFSMEEDLRENLEKIRDFNNRLKKNAATVEELREYPRYIYSITNCFSKNFNVFLSYSTKDSKNFNIAGIAEKLENYPEIDKVFYWEVDSGEDVVKYMERTLDISQIFILFCSNNAKKSRAVEGEWSTAYQLMKDDKMKIIPVYEDKKFIPNLLLPLILVEHTKDQFDIFIENLHNEVIRKPGV